MSENCRAFICSSLIALAAFTGGCSSSSSSSDEMVKPKLEVINQTKSALVVEPGDGVYGTYGTCVGHGGADTWFLLADNTTDLTVVKNDTACVLTIGTLTSGTDTFIGAPAIAVDDVWQTVGSTFSLVGDPGTELRFYGNARLDAKTFATDFVLSVLVSDTPSASSLPKSATDYATRSASLEASGVPAPNYAIDFADFTITKDVNDFVDVVSGYAQLSADTFTGEDYAIVSDSVDGSSTFAAVEAAFNNALPGTHGLLVDLTTLQLPAAGFALSGDLNLFPQRTVIIRHEAQGVFSYQLIVVTFTP